MRKIVTNSQMPRLHSDESILTDFYNTRLSTHIADARERSSRRAMAAGHPDGKLDVPGKRGWIYAQKFHPGGGSTTVQVYVPTNADGTKKVKIAYGAPIAPEPTSDTNPTYWMYNGQPPATPVKHLPYNQSYDACGGPGQGNGPKGFGSGGGGSTSGCSDQWIVQFTSFDGQGNTIWHTYTQYMSVCTDGSPCAGQPASRKGDVFDCPDLLGGVSNAGGLKWWIKKGSSDDQSGSGANGKLYPGDSKTQTKPVIPAAHTTGIGKSKYNSGVPNGNKAKAPYPIGTFRDSDVSTIENQGTNQAPGTPSSAPPASPTVGQLWNDGNFTRQYSGNNISPSGWTIQSGPNSGSYADYRVASDDQVFKGEVAWLKDPSNQLVGLAGTTDLTIAGKIVGVVLDSSSVGKGFATVQTSGIASIPLRNDANFGIGDQVWLDTHGQLWPHPPSRNNGIDLFAQRIGTCIGPGQILIQIEPPIVLAQS